MPTQMLRMAKKKPAANAKNMEQYRKAYKPTRIRMALAVVAERRAEELQETFTTYVNAAVRMRLEADGLWPPKE